MSKEIQPNRTFIIAEAGVNHNGQLDMAMDLIRVAADCGSDAIKFQTFKAEQVVTKEGDMAEYQKKNLGIKTSQLDMLRSLELPENFYTPLIKECKKRKIVFLSTPHGGKKSVEFLEELHIPMYKIGSGDLTNYILLSRVAKTKKPIILSSGMATMKEVKNALSFLKKEHSGPVNVLHCTTNYPCPPGEVNLSAMVTMINQLSVPVGYSDHTLGLQTAIMAVTLGAKLYECHFTLDKFLPGPDHVASANPKELQQRIEAIRNVEVILGSPEKKPTKSEKDSMITTIRRSIVAAHDIHKGQVILEDDIEAKRPGNGISPALYRDFIGKRAKRDLSEDQQITYKDIIGRSSK